MSLRKELRNITCDQVEQVARRMAAAGLLSRDSEDRMDSLWEMAEGDMVALGHLGPLVVRVMADEESDLRWTGTEREILSLGIDLAVIVLRQLSDSSTDNSPDGACESS